MHWYRKKEQQQQLMPGFGCDKSCAPDQIFFLGKKKDVKYVLQRSVRVSTHTFPNVASVIALIKMEMVHRDFRCSVWIRLGQRSYCVTLFHYSDSLTD